MPESNVGGEAMSICGYVGQVGVVVKWGVLVKTGKIGRIVGVVGQWAWRKCDFDGKD